MDPSRISIRQFNLSDVDDFLSWASDDKVTQTSRWNTINTKEDALKYIKNVAIPHPFHRSICLDGRSIGYVSITPESGEDRCRAHISYALGSEYWGRGIMPIASSMAISNALKKFPDMVRVEALVEIQNEGSQRVLEKIGFQKEGMLRKYGYSKGEIKDVFIFSFL